MRLDKYLSQNTNLSRSLAKKAIVSAKVSVNQKSIRNGAYQLADNDEVVYLGQQLLAIGKQYIMLNKPKGYICSTKDENHPSILNLIEIEHKDKLHIVGRLDVDTTGLVLITDDGHWTHKITSPNSACQKKYQVILAEPISSETSKLFKKGLLLKNETKLTLPAQLILADSPADNKKCLINIQEGRYHQVKRMFAAVGNHVLQLHRLSIGNIRLDTQLKEGQWRYLTENEIKLGT